jgi:hypothetical protein
MFFARPPFTPAMKRQQMQVYRVWLIFGWGIFPVTLVAVYAGAFHLIGRFARAQLDAMKAGRAPWPWPWPRS